MSRRRRGDDEDQHLMPLPGIERIEPGGTITSSPVLAKPVASASAIPLSTPAESSVPIVPASINANARRLEAHGAWVFGRGIHLKVLSVGTRSWREFLAWETARAVIWYAIAPALISAVLLFSNCSGSPPPPPTLDGWAPINQSK